MLLSHIPNIACECLNLKFALKLPNMMRMDGAGLVQNDVFAKALRMLAELLVGGPELLVCCLAHRGPTGVFLLLRS